MPSEWSYLIVVLCVSVTSSSILNFHGNAVHPHGDESSDVKQGESLTPPIGCLPEEKELRGSSNEAICRELCKKGDGGNACLCDWAPLKKQVLFALKNLHKERPLSFIKFPTVKEDPACGLLCPNGDQDHFCLCD